MTKLSEVSDVDCIIVAVAHHEFKLLSLDTITNMYKNVPDEERVFIDVKGLYDLNKLKESGIKFWRL